MDEVTSIPPRQRIEPLALFVPRLGRRRRRIWFPEVAQALAGEKHDPVVYFIRIGRHVKIGTTTNLRQRLGGLYLGLDAVLALVPGGRDVEAEYHNRFSASHVEVAGRTEMFRLGFWLRLFLARCHCRWHETLAATLVGWTTGCALALSMGLGGFVLGALTAVGIIGAHLCRIGWWELGQEFPASQMNQQGSGLKC